LYFVQQSMVVVLPRTRCSNQQLEFHSDRLLGSGSYELAGNPDFRHFRVAHSSTARYPRITVVM
jgi:hypothetical protein